MEVFVAGEEEGERREGRGDREAGTNGGKRGGGGQERRGLRREEDAVSAPEWWVGTARSLMAWPGCPPSFPFPSQEANKEMDGWMEWVEWRRWWPGG
ncbi:hypothetical protein PR202_gb06042 [Eleusine coracana subsp. coracana]|uniref:Uncharacterized protein n=1 Tax=Eleusine coracana subsp. coracana TaxID=191504 RepID=A0AAV5E638_ELECO|nr:hypothetical protein PR202_gb06042 [Eleusine coracana subsp. coracana]